MLRKPGTVAAFAAVMGLMFAGLAQAADPPPSAGKSVGNVSVATHYRASKLIGMPVKNPQGEKLGKVEDFVLNMENGKIQYAALSYGGILGIGDKLFAVPLNQLKLNYEKDETYFVTNLTKEQLSNAPGFDKNNWPTNLDDPQFHSQLDQYYRTTERPAAERR
jgi:sporulation protein YlmC with PRC-barrel domain